MMGWRTWGLNPSDPKLDAIGASVGRETKCDFHHTYARALNYGVVEERGCVERYPPHG